MDIVDDFDKATSDAFKVLGNNGSIPTRKVETAFIPLEDSFKALKAIKTAVDLLSKNVPGYRNAMSKIQSAWPAAKSELAVDNYALDPKKPEDKKKIDQARAIFDRYFSAYSRILSTQVQAINEIGRHLDQFDKLTDKLIQIY